MSREIDVHIEELPHDIVYMKTTVRDTAVTEDKFTNSSDAQSKVENRHTRSGFGIVFSGLGTTVLGIYGATDFLAGAHNGNFEQMKSGFCELVLCSSVVLMGYRAFQENLITSKQISELKKHFPKE
jgi:hypothetical protein